MIRVLREIHDAPTSVQQRIAEAGGLNRFGEPNFRVVWGGSRLTWIGGRWTDRDANGNIVRERVELRREPKYVPLDRWHIERWMPPEAYGSPEPWYKQSIETEGGLCVPALGPYPSRGEYEHCFTLQGTRGEFIPLTAAACEWIARAVEWSRWQPRSTQRAANESKEVRRARYWDRVADDVLDDAVPAFSGQSFVTR
jgi:choline dehydrogenase-like flavoprotein